MKKLTQKEIHLVSVIYTLTVLSAFAYGFIYITPIYVLSIGGNAIDVSWFLTAAGLASISLVSQAGKMSYHFGASNVCALGLLLICAGDGCLILAHSVGFIFILAGILFGIGWSLFYAATPILMNALSTDQNRGKRISYLSSFIVCGTALSPVFTEHYANIHQLNHHLYFIPLVTCLVMAVLFMATGKFGINKANIAKPKSLQKNPKTFISVMQTEAKYPIIMVFLGACVFSSMMNYQTLYAIQKQVDFSVYYLVYMTTVISSRFIFGGILSAKNPIKLTPYLLMLMLAALAGLIFLPHGSQFLYALIAIAMGISYGLVYPLIKTYAVNVSEPGLRDHAIAYFTQSYFIGVYFFPLIAGSLIHLLGFKGLLGVLMIIVIFDALIGTIKSIRPFKNLDN